MCLCTEFCSPSIYLAHEKLWAEKTIQFYGCRKLYLIVVTKQNISSKVDVNTNMWENMSQQMTPSTSICFILAIGFITVKWGKLMGRIFGIAPMAVRLR